MLLLPGGTGDAVGVMILLPRRHASSGADFSPLLLQLGLARYTCGGKRILLGRHDGGGTELEGRCGGNDRCGRLTGVRPGCKVESGRRIRRERERFAAAFLNGVVVIIIVAAGAELEGRRGRLAVVHARSKLKHLLGLGLIGGRCRCSERTPARDSTEPNGRRRRPEGRCRRLAKDGRSSRLLLLTDYWCRCRRSSEAARTERRRSVVSDSRSS